nr:GntR family transcriptional regulator [uncultured Celeribacter sp.]
MTDAPLKEPAHLRVYRGIRDQILSGDLVPGQPVTIQGLTDALGAGMTPVREAIRRLTSEGALEFHGNRRVTVPVLTVAQVDELIFARAALEPELARQAAARIMPAQIKTIVAADAAIDRALQAGDIRGYLIHNHQFHMAIYGVAGAKVIGALVDTLWLRSAPALRVMSRHFGAPPALPDMHVAAIAALEARDGEAAAAAIRADILQGMENVRAAILEGAL